MFKLASWNVNSLKVRLEHILTWLDSTGIDVLALQETKLIDDHFPLNVFNELGYHAIYAGQKSYNGVAIISRYPMSNTLYEIPGLEDPQRRVLATNIGDLRLINLYVPNGSQVNSDKYVYKLDWIKKVTAFITEQVKSHPLLAVVGDFNIAPEDIDVHDPAEWEGSVLVSPRERQAFKEILGLGLTDSVRHHFREEQLFSWWDYRAANFRRNRGVRIDHILLSKALNGVCIQSKIDKDPRKWERPSDHAPVWVELQYELNTIRHCT